MLQGASLSWAAVMAAVPVYTYIVAAIWIGSRATLHAIVSGGGEAEDPMFALYEKRYESLLNAAFALVYGLSSLIAFSLPSGKIA